MTISSITSRGATMPETEQRDRSPLRSIVTNDHQLNETANVNLLHTPASPSDQNSVDSLHTLSGLEGKKLYSNYNDIFG